MSRITDKFQSLKAQNEAALIIFLTAGDPSLEKTLELVLAFEEAGADIIELGVPFSDPLADGPVIQAASQRGLESGTTVARILDGVATIRETSQVPLLLMTCYNPVLQYGLERFVADAKAAGVDGMLISDLPPEEAGDWNAANPRETGGLDNILLLAPTSPDARIRLAAENGSGFVYCVSRTGVTGQRESLPEDLTQLVTRIKAATTMPVAVGFGVSSRDQVATVVQGARADGAVVGSAVVDRIAGGQSVAELAAFVRELKQGTRPT
jgi:tryptophan synthase alpha chain